MKKVKVKWNVLIKLIMFIGLLAVEFVDLLYDDLKGELKWERK